MASLSQKEDLDSVMPYLIKTVRDGVKYVDKIYEETKKRLIAQITTLLDVWKTICEKLPSEALDNFFEGTIHGVLFGEKVYALEGYAYRNEGGDRDDYVPYFVYGEKSLFDFEQVTNEKDTDPKHLNEYRINLHECGIEELFDLHECMANTLRDLLDSVRDKEKKKETEKTAEEDEAEDYLHGGTSPAV